MVIHEITKKDFYWGVSDRDTAVKFILMSKEKGFFEAIKDPQFKVFQKYASSDERANFLEKLFLKKDFSALDLGSGYGNITIPLAKKVQKVFAADGTKELLEFSMERARAEGADNIEYYHTDPADFCNLPFNPKSFDVIILNGVLEWIGTGDISRNPQEIQEITLRYLHTLLKDEGFIYIGIENRWWPMYFYNVRDPHTKKLFTAILPRFISNLLMKFYGHKEGYRTYIYSLFGYKKLFKKSGFNIEKCFLPIVSYREPTYMVDSDSKLEISLAFEKDLWSLYHRKVFNLLKIFKLLGLFKYVAHSFGFVIKKTN